MGLVAKDKNTTGWGVQRSRGIRHTWMKFRKVGYGADRTNYSRKKGKFKLSWHIWNSKTKIRIRRPERLRVEKERKG